MCFKPAVNILRAAELGYLTCSIPCYKFTLQEDWSLSTIVIIAFIYYLLSILRLHWSESAVIHLSVRCAGTGMRTIESSRISLLKLMICSLRIVGIPEVAVRQLKLRSNNFERDRSTPLAFHHYVASSRF